MLCAVSCYSSPQNGYKYRNKPTRFARKPGRFERTPGRLFTPMQCEEGYRDMFTSTVHGNMYVSLCVYVQFVVRSDGNEKNIRSFVEK